MKKKMIALLTATVLAVSMLVGCGNSSEAPAAEEAAEEEVTEETEEVTEEVAAEEVPEETDDVWARVQESGKIIVGSSGTYSPYCYFDEDGNITGFDIELSRKVAEKLGVEMEYVQTKWDSLIAGIQSDRLDLVANQVGITDERKEAVDFSQPYCAIYPALAVAEDSDIASFEDIDGKSICVNLTTVFAPLAEQYGATTVSSEGQMTNEVSMLQAGRVDGTIDDNVTLQTYINNNPDCGIKVVAIEESTPTYIGMLIKKGSTTFETKVNEALAQLEEEGVIKELAEQFVGMDISVK